MSTRAGMTTATSGRVRLRAVAGALEVYADKPVEVGRDSGLVGSVAAIHDPTRAMVEVERTVDLAALITEAGLRSAGGLEQLPAIDPSAAQPTSRGAALEVAWLSIRRARAAARCVTAEGDRALVLAQLAGAVTNYAGAQPDPTLESRIKLLEGIVARVANGEGGSQVRADATAAMVAAR